jgi:hypothetical protein
MTLARFIGDPTGYVIDESVVHLPTIHPGPRIRGGWVPAAPGGQADKRVLVNLDQAYLIDDTETATGDLR